MAARRKKLVKSLMKRFNGVLQKEPVFVENGIKGMFGLVLAFGWLNLSPQVSGQILLCGSFVLGLYARMAVTPVRGRTSGEKPPAPSMEPAAPTGRPPEPAEVRVPAADAVPAA
jgi:hypothetical protein